MKRILAALAATFALGAYAAGEPEFKLVIENHKFTPETVTVPERPWTLGAIGGPNSMRAVVQLEGLQGNPVTFEAVGCEGGGGAGYQITLCSSSSVNA